MYGRALPARQSITRSKSIISEAYRAGRLNACAQRGPLSETHSRHFFVGSGGQQMSGGATTTATAATNTNEAAPAEPTLQYVVLRKDLWKEMKWPLGSIVAQGCHAAHKVS